MAIRIEPLSTETVASASQLAQTVFPYDAERNIVHNVAYGLVWIRLRINRCGKV